MTVPYTYTTWQAAISLAYGAATARYPEHTARIKRGALIAAERDMVQGQRVLSSDGKTWYTVQGATCDCPDHEPLCKHRWALAISRKAEAIHAGMLEPTAQWVATDTRTGESGVAHEIDGTYFLVPYGGPHGDFVPLADLVLGTRCDAFTPAPEPVETDEDAAWQWWLEQEESARMLDEQAA